MAKLKTEQPVDNAKIITLAYHVDYWDYLGWKDKFSNPQFSRRQTEYAYAFNLRSNYTPQMIVDGRAEFVGSKYARALGEIEKAAKFPKSKVEIDVHDSLLNLNIKVKISELDLSEDSNVWLALTEDSLETSVTRGENIGKKLSHMSVVRTLEKIGHIAKGEEAFETEKSVKLIEKWKQENISIAVFVQNNSSKNIRAVGIIEKL